MSVYSLPPIMLAINTHPQGGPPPLSPLVYKNTYRAQSAPRHAVGRDPNAESKNLVLSTSLQHMTLMTEIETPRSIGASTIIFFKLVQRPATIQIADSDPLG